MTFVLDHGAPGPLALVRGGLGRSAFVPQAAPAARWSPLVSSGLVARLAAMARVLDVALAGPRSYGGRRTEFPWVHPDGRREVGPVEVERSVRVLWAAWAILVAVAALLALL